MKKIFILLLLALLFPASSFAKEKTYLYADLYYGMPIEEIKARTDIISKDGTTYVALDKIQIMGWNFTSVFTCKNKKLRKIMLYTNTRQMSPRELSYLSWDLLSMTNQMKLVTLIAEGSGFARTPFFKNNEFDLAIKNKYYRYYSLTSKDVSKTKSNNVKKILEKASPKATITEVFCEGDYVGMTFQRLTNCKKEDARYIEIFNSLFKR